MSIASEPRLLRLSDIPAAMALCGEAGWNQTAEDWHMLIELYPDGCFSLDITGELAATTTLVHYGSRLGWIGMVLTAQRFRRRGCAHTLLRHALAHAATKDIATLKLDATAMGMPLYASLGFHEEQPVERWFRETSPLTEPPPHFIAQPIPPQMDFDAFGADRSAVLEAIVSRGHLTTGPAAYACSRSGRLAHYLGPCIAENPSAAKNVIEQQLSLGGKWFWDLLPTNNAAAELAHEFGFAPARKLKRMSRGAPMRTHVQNVFALAGFELG